MEKEKFALIKKENNTPVRQDSGTGLTVIDSFLADSGFNYVSGARRFGDLTIIESVGQGTAVAYLNRVSVVNRENKLIIDKQVEKGTYYSRETVRLIVMNELLDMLERAAVSEGKNYDRDKAREVIDEKLDKAYYKESYESVLNWAASIGIKLNASS